MIMGWIWTVMLPICLISAVINGTGSALAASIMEGAQAGVSLAIAMAGSILLWTGVGHLMEKAGLTEKLSLLLKPILCRIFPSAKYDRELSNHLSANICANFLGLGNAATPMGILAAKRLASHSRPGFANDQLCRLIVLNTASIQLIPANVAAVRVSLGCATPFDILPAVWLTSVCSAGIGLICGWLLGKVWRND